MTIRQKSSQSMRPPLRKRKTLKRKNKIGKANRSGKKTLKVPLDDQDGGAFFGMGSDSRVNSAAANYYPYKRFYTQSVKKKKENGRDDHTAPKVACHRHT